jgi:hypothetical protein
MDLIEYTAKNFLDNILIDKENLKYKNIEIKYNDLYKNYRCFISKNIFNEEYNKNYIKKTVVENQKWNNRKNIDKSILGILNILNTSNYPKMLEKMKNLKNSENINTIINEILNICSKQAFYLKIYIQFIEDIIKGCIDIDKKIILLIINDYISKSINTIEVYLKNDSNKLSYSVKEYDNFCIGQKEKNLIVSTNMIVINLFKKFDTHTNLSSYYRILKNILENELSDEKLILAIQLLIHMKINDNTLNIDINIDPGTENKRLQFLVEELNSLCFSNVKK